MKKNPLLKLKAFGQSIWLDYIGRSRIASGELALLIKKDGLCGVTSNPSIFEKTIAGSPDYDDAIRVHALNGKTVDQIFRALTVEDIQSVADRLRTVYDRLDGADGFVSLEVSPHLARNSAGTLTEARQLWKAVARQNVMIKVPATVEGLTAIEHLIGEGINVNVTQLFGLPRYRQVAEAYIAGLELLAARGKPLKSVASVASFFLSRIDALLDPVIGNTRGLGKTKAEFIATFHGQVAILSAKAAYQMYTDLFGSERFGILKSKGARTQRLLWASTSTKNSAYSDLKYVEALIGADTINTLPLETLAAYRDHGDPASRLTDGAGTARETLRRLSEVGIDLDAVTQQLESEGTQEFVKAYDGLMTTLEDRGLAAVQSARSGSSIWLR